MKLRKPRVLVYVPRSFSYQKALVEVGKELLSVNACVILPTNPYAWDEDRIIVSW